MKLVFSKEKPTASITYGERSGTVCDAGCRAEALRQATLTRAVLHGQRF